MISVSEAKQKILSILRPLDPVSVPLSEALFRVMAEDVVASIALPGFDNSAMDGFALRSADTVSASEEHPVRLRIVGTCKAGDPGTLSVNSGEAIRIMTGAPIPTGADAVVIKEKVSVQNDELRLKEAVPPGDNIRRCGEEISPGQKVLSAGTALSSRHIGFLASLGITDLTVHRTPAVGIVSTGSELAPAMGPSAKLTPGRIYDSNTPMLAACLQELALKPDFVQQVPDDPKKIFASLQEGLGVSDVLLVSGGVSVGDFDYTKGLFKDLGIREIFWVVQQKPGKPFYFGIKGKKLVFGLPGNPASVWICFHQYIRPALSALLGHREVKRESIRAPLKQSLRGDPHKTLFLKGRWDGTNNNLGVLPLSGQGSHMLGSLAEADCLIQVNQGEKTFPVGEAIEIHPFFSPFFSGAHLND